MSRLDFSSLDALRESIGEKRGRTFPEILLHLLDAAEHDAEVAETDLAPSARQMLNEVAGDDLYAFARTTLEMLIAAGPELMKEASDAPVPE